MKVDTKRHYRTQKIIKKPKCVVDYSRLMETVERIAMPVPDLRCWSMYNTVSKNSTRNTIIES